MSIIQLLESYHPSDTYEASMLKDTLTFVHTYANCLERSLTVGHITTSCWITDKSRQYVLLTHHRKLNKWFQLGGHADGEKDLHKSALKEAKEESGLMNIHLLTPEIFDVDIHLIPTRKLEPQHYHYDIRFLMEADKNQPLIINHESKDLTWIAIEKVKLLNSDESILRMVRKHQSMFRV